MEHSRRFGNKAQSSGAVQHRNVQGYRAQNIAPNETTGNLASERQSLVFATFTLLKDRLSLGHVRLQMLTENLKEYFLMSLSRMQLHQPYGDGVEVGTVDNDAWSNRFFHERYHSRCPSLLKALYT